MYDPASIVRGKDAMLQNYKGDSFTAALSVDGVILDAKFDRGELTVEVARESIVQACEALRVDGYSLLEDVTAVDWYPSEPRFQIVYHFLSFTQKRRIRLIVRLNGDEPLVDSITPTWPAANFYEREIFDLFGVHFGGHPNLRRIMMPEDWNGHPLRKDYPVEGYR
jgi:NADH-quinone oxidoreductase subunit C